MPSLTVENYLKAILQLAISTGVAQVATGQLATALEVAPGSVTSMLKTLAEAGLIDYTPYEGARLTESGRTLALRMLRRHRLIELFLVRTLDDFLGHPACDPHGDPIPAADGQMRGESSNAIPLAGCQAGSKVRFVRVIDQGAEFLRYLSDQGLELGSVGVVTQNSVEAGLVTANIDERSISLGHQAAEHLLVEPVV
jgi:DtxR family Mn-dependent transcriptional regulator